MEYLYLVCILISLGMLFWLKIFDVRNSIIQFITLLIVVISNLGSYFVAISTNLGEAVIAQKMTYVGGAFLPVFYFLLMLEICHIDFKKILTIILLMIQCVLYGFICTIGKSDIFYKNVSLGNYYGVTYLEREYGPFHAFYLATMYFYLIAGIAVVIYSLIKKKSTNRRAVIAMVILSTVVVAAYVIQRLTGSKLDLIPVVYILLMIGTLIPIYNTNLYTVHLNTDIIDEQLSEIGFMTFDRKRGYKGCNPYMEGVFPELANYEFGKKIENCSETLRILINQIDELEERYIKNPKKTHEHLHLESFWLDDKCYEGMIHVVTNAFGSLKGFTIEIEDDTADHLVMDLKEKYNEELSREVYEKTRKIRRIQHKTILGMAQMVESRDLSTGGHIKRTSDVVKIFSKKLARANMGLKKDFLNLVVRSAPMHDLGKIGVDDAILRKQGRFTDEEYEQMKKHSEIGYHMVTEILADVEEPEFVQVAENVAHYHHEKVNGRGYPHGLSGDEIPVEARIMALADVFDALVSKRCYKEAFSYDEAFDIIEKDSGSHFDASLAQVFISCRPELEEYYNKNREL